MSWADFITEDLRVRICQSRDLCGKLTLQDLAQLYGVSITPVRVAVKTLVRQGYLLKGRNGRLKVNQRKAANTHGNRAARHAEHPTDHFEAIARDLAVRSLNGQAVYLRETEISRQYCISRTKVRHIFNRLAGAGIIDHIPRRGWRLRPFNREDLDAFLDIREALELRALESARGKLVKSDLEAFLEGNVVDGVNGQPKVDNSLHEYIIEKANNRYIRDFFDHYGKYYELLFDWEDSDTESAMMAVREHRAILTALLQEDKRAAKKAMVEHIRNNHTFLKQLHSRADAKTGTE